MPAGRNPAVRHVETCQSARCARSTLVDRMVPARKDQQLTNSLVEILNKRPSCGFFARLCRQFGYFLTRASIVARRESPHAKTRRFDDRPLFFDRSRMSACVSRALGRCRGEEPCDQARSARRRRRNTARNTTETRPTRRSRRGISTGAGSNRSTRGRFSSRVGQIVPRAWSMASSPAPIGRSW